MSTGWEEVAGGRLRLREGRVGGRGHDGAVAGRACRRGRRELRHVEAQCRYSRGGWRIAGWTVRAALLLSMPRPKKHAATARKNGLAVKAVTELQQEHGCSRTAAAFEMRDRRKRELLESRADLLRSLQKLDIIMGMASRMEVTSEHRDTSVRVCIPPACSGPPAADLSLLRLCSGLCTAASGS